VFVEEGAGREVGYGELGVKVSFLEGLTGGVLRFWPLSIPEMSPVPGLSRKPHNSL
jgi:hypothetical protein